MVGTEIKVDMESRVDMKATRVDPVKEVGVAVKVVKVTRVVLGMIEIWAVAETGVIQVLQVIGETREAMVV